MMMNSAELGNWRSPERGKVPFNWECQPLLVEIAPALLQRYQRTTTPNDCLIAGPSGAGYVVPPLMPNLPAYMERLRAFAARQGSMWSPPMWLILPGGYYASWQSITATLLGYLCGYAVVSRAPQSLIAGVPIIANQSPLVAEIALHAEDLLPTIHKRLLEPSQDAAFHRGAPFCLPHHHRGYR